MKVEYEISTTEMLDRLKVLTFLEQYRQFKSGISDYYVKLLNDGLLDEIEEELESLYHYWVSDQHKKLKNVLDTALVCGDVDLSVEGET